MANNLTDLPVGIGRMKCLERLKASKNRITFIPNSIVRLLSLECLWLDFNRISALPTNFHLLKRLKVIKLEGNVDLVYPTIDVVVKGAEEILRWSRTRLETSITARNNQIVQSVQEVLSLVKKHRIGGRLHLSLFHINDNYYQFPPDVLWSVFIPECRKLWSEDNSANDGIKSFPFEREEVEQALYRFNDAAGAIIRKLPNALFKRCSCISTGR